MNKKELKQTIREVIEEIKEEQKPKKEKKKSSKDLDKELKQMIDKLLPKDQDFINHFITKGIQTEKNKNFEEGVSRNIDLTMLFFCLAIDNFQKFKDNKEYRNEVVKMFVLMKTQDLGKMIEDFKNEKTR